MVKSFTDLLRAAGSGFKSQTILPSSVSPRISPAYKFLSTPARQPCPPEKSGRACSPQSGFHWPFPLLRYLRLSRPFGLITNVINDSMCFQKSLDWSMRGTIVSGVGLALTARPTAFLATAHLAQTKSVCSALSTGEPQWRHDFTNLCRPFFTDGFLRPSNYLLGGRTGMLLAQLKVLLPFLRRTGLLGCSPGPTQHSSAQFGILRLFSVLHLSVPRTVFSEQLGFQGHLPRSELHKAASSASRSPPVFSQLLWVQ